MMKKKIKYYAFHGFRFEAGPVQLSPDQTMTKMTTKRPCPLINKMMTLTDLEGVRNLKPVASWKKQYMYKNHEEDTPSEILFKFITAIGDKKIKEMIKRQGTQEEEDQDEMGFQDEDETHEKTYSPILLFLWTMEHDKKM